MAHRSVLPSDIDTDTDVGSDDDLFWHDAARHRPPLLERAAALAWPLRSWLVAAASVAGVLGVGWWLLRPSAPPIETALPAAEAAPAAAGAGEGAPSTVSGTGMTTSTTAAVVVQAAGAVADPGVYELPGGSRVDDLVEAAGGLTKGADVDRVNLAAPVADGERIWVPSEGETEVPDIVAGVGGGSGGSGGSGGAAGGGEGGAGSVLPASPIDLNAATAEELEALPGVGPATAAAILAYRDQHGRFRSVEELLEVRGIGDAKLEQIRPLVQV